MVIIFLKIYSTAKVQPFFKMQKKFPSKVFPIEKKLLLQIIHLQLFCLHFVPKGHKCEAQVMANEWKSVPIGAKIFF